MRYGRAVRRVRCADHLRCHTPRAVRTADPTWDHLLAAGQVRRTPSARHGPDRAHWLDAKQDGVPPHGQRVHGCSRLEKENSPRPARQTPAASVCAVQRHAWGDFPMWLSRRGTYAPRRYYAGPLRSRPALHRSYQHPHVRGTHVTRVHHGIDSLGNSVRHRAPVLLVWALTIA